MNRLLINLSALSLLAAIDSFAQAPQTEQPVEAECATLCKLSTADAPPGCDCSLTGSAGGGAGSFEERTVIDLLNDMRAGYIAQMAAVENYWIVEASDSSPYPITRYFERQPGADNGDPRYREVPPDELARREMLNDPRLSEEEKQAFSDPAGMYGGYAAAMDAFGEVTGEATGGATSGAFAGLADAFRGVEAGARADKAKREAEATLGGDIPSLVTYIQSLMMDNAGFDYDNENERIITARSGIFWPLRPMGVTDILGECSTFDPEAQLRFLSWPYAQYDQQTCAGTLTYFKLLREPYIAYFWGETTVMPDPSMGIPCDIARTTRDIDINYEGNDYRLQKGSEIWLLSDVRYYPLVYYQLRLLALESGQYRQMTLEREMFIHRPAGPMVIAREIRERIDGLVGGLIEDHKSIRSVGFNQGPPTQEQIQQSTW